MTNHKKETSRWMVVEDLGAITTGPAMAEYYHLLETGPKVPVLKWRKADHMGTLIPPKRRKKV
jgi:hypothetical protein